MFYVNGVFFPSWCSLFNCRIIHGHPWTITFFNQVLPTHKMIFQRKKTKKMKKFKNDWSSIVQGFILLRTNRDCTVMIVTFDERKIRFDWMVIDCIKSMSCYHFRIFSRKLYLNIFSFHHRIRWFNSIHMDHLRSLRMLTEKSFLNPSQFKHEIIILDMKSTLSAINFQHSKCHCCWSIWRVDMCPKQHRMVKWH